MSIPGLSSINGTLADHGLPALPGENKITVNYGTPVDYTQAGEYASDDNKIVSLAQAQSQAFQLQQISLDRDLQHAADLERGMEGLDTRLQLSKLNYVQEMSAEENRHQERLAQTHAKYASVTKNSQNEGCDLPPPDFNV